MSSRISVVDKFSLAVSLVFLAPLRVLTGLLRALCITLVRGIPPKLYLRCAVIRVVLGTFKPLEIQYLSPSTNETYNRWTQRSLDRAKNCPNDEFRGRLQHDVEPLEDGNSSLLWIGNRTKARKVVLFFHGGGYVSPLLPGHLEWCWRAYVRAGIQMNVEVAVAVLQYTLCPHARYPVQLRQAVSGLQHILASGYDSNDVVIGGDSAGGNLTAQLLCHLIEPHPTAKTVHLPKPLAGAFLVSPWLSRHTTHASFSDNGWIDMLTGPIVDISTRELLGDSALNEEEFMKNELAFPLDMEEHRLSGMATVVKTLYVTAGNHEVFRDQVVAFVRAVKRLNPMLELRFDIQPNEAHDFILLEGQEEASGECIDAMMRWMMDIIVED